MDSMDRWDGHVVISSFGVRVRGQAGRRAGGQERICVLSSGGALRGIRGGKKFHLSECVCEREREREREGERVISYSVSIYL